MAEGSISRRATSWPSASDGGAHGLPSGNTTTRRRKAANSRLGKLAITPSKASPALNRQSCSAQCSSGRSAAGRPSSSKRLRAQEARYIWASTSPRRAESFSLRFSEPPRLPIARSAVKAKAADMRVSCW